MTEFTDMQAVRPQTHPALLLFCARLRLFLTRVGCDRRGTAIVDFGLIVPMLALMVLAVSDIGLGVRRKMQVENAVQTAAAYAIARGFDAAAVTSIVTGSVNGVTINASPAPTQFCGCATGTAIAAATCGSICPNGNAAGTYVTISAQSSYSTTLNYSVVPNTYTFTAASTVRLQ